MIERPILFSAPMVRAILAGQKTQTRRVVRKQFPADAIVAEVAATTPEGWQVSGHSGLWWDDAGACLDDAVRCPQGMPGDRLWVRETFWAFGRWETRFNAKKGRDEWRFIDLTVQSGSAYQFAEPEQSRHGKRGGTVPRWWKRPSIHMPRAASRILLDVADVRVERLQDISADDARAEGCPDMPVRGAQKASIDLLAKLWFHGLWEQISGPESWAANPWVWVVSFKRVEAA